MDIAIIGPEKFAFQDMACIELALAYRPFGPFTFVPEPEGGEDSTLQWAGPPPLRLEVQVKGADGTAGLKELLKYVAHFPAGKSTQCLLERLMDQPHTHALFIMSARCTDQIAPLLVDGPPLAAPVARPASVSNLAAELKAALAASAGKSKKKASKLATARTVVLQALAARPVADFERALAKTSFREKESAESIEVRLHAKLTAERFDSLSVRGALAHVTDVLAAAKRTQTDAIAPILAKFTELAPSGLRPPGYQERGVEDGLEGHLREHPVLLLAGPPRAGKSWTALALAERLQRAGYEVRSGNSVLEADHFLSDAVVKPRVYLLDDPIGSREPVKNASAELMALNGLCQRIPANRRLIVAQVEHVLLQVRATTDLAACALGAHAWLRLNPAPVDFAVSVWTTAAQAQGLAPSDIERVVGLIQSDPTLRDPGALAYLAQSWSELSPQAADSEIIFQARRDATDFAHSLAGHSPAVRDLLTASAFATGPAQATSETELAFVIHGGDSAPGLEPQVRSFSLLGDDADRPPPPSYTALAPLDAAQRAGLELLQRRRVLGPYDGGFNFTHAYLRAGAQTLVTPDIASDAPMLLAQLRRGLGCASPLTSLACARNLWWLRSALRDHLDEVFHLAYDATRSMFPATRDACFQFLIEYARDLPAEIDRELPELAEGTVVSFSRLDTANGVGFISNRYDLLAKPDSLTNVQPFLQAIEDGAPLGLDLSLSRRILGALEAHPHALSKAVAERFLVADEAMVRAAAAKLWIEQARDHDDDILARLASDLTPSMSVALLEGLAHHWEALPPGRRGRLLELLQSHAQSHACASVLFTRLVVLNRDGKYGPTPPWEIFTTLTPRVIANLPVSVALRNGRLNDIIDDAIRVLPRDALAPVLQAWGDRLIQRISNVGLDEYELCIVEPLIDGTSRDVRQPLFERLLSVDDTGARTVTLRWLLNGWGELTPAERALVESTLEEVRPDRRWLLATVLTRSNPPAALLACIAGDADVLRLPASQLEACLGTELFAACLHMHVGWPQPLWWYALHHAQSEWERVVRELAQLPAHALHPVAFYEIARYGKKGELESLMRALPEAALWPTFERLLDIKVSTVADWNQGEWLLLLGRLEQAGLLERAIERIDAVLEGILESFNDLFDWLAESPFTGKVLNLLRTDVNAFEAVKKLRFGYEVLQEQNERDPQVNPKADQILEAIADAVLQPALDAPPRLFGTWDMLRREAKAMDLSDRWIQTLDEKRTQALKRHSTLRQQAPGSPGDFPLPGWIDHARVNPARASNTSDEG